MSLPAADKRAPVGSDRLPLDLLLLDMRLGFLSDALYFNPCLLGQQAYPCYNSGSAPKDPEKIIFTLLSTGFSGCEVGPIKPP